MSVMKADTTASQTRCARTHMAVSTVYAPEGIQPRRSIHLV